MRKLFVCCIILYILTEGENIIGDGLYVFRRASHAVDQLAEQVDAYGPGVAELDSAMGEAVNAYIVDSTRVRKVEPPPSPEPSRRRVIHR